MTQIEQMGTDFYYLKYFICVNLSNLCHLRAIYNFSSYKGLYSSNFLICIGQGFTFNSKNKQLSHGHNDKERENQIQ